jgi:hypothetical protein
MTVKKSEEITTTGTSDKISERKYGVGEYQELKCSRLIVGRSIGTKVKSEK